MSERDRYPPGVPCWVETLQPDPRAAMDFYRAVFGWEFAGPGPMPGDAKGEYFVARLRGRDVAGIGSLPARAGRGTPAWTTYVRVESADEAAANALAAGARLLDGPLDALPAGRLAALADPAGAPFCLWEARGREGAQVVNEPRAWAMSMLQTPDPEGANAFYRAVFGWQPEPFDAGGARFTLWRLPGYVGGEPEQPVPRDVVAVMAPLGGTGSQGEVRARWSVDFWVDDVDAVVETVATAGGKVIVAPEETPGFKSAVLADPGGAVFSASQLVRRAASRGARPTSPGVQP